MDIPVLSVHVIKTFQVSAVAQYLHPLAGSYYSPSLSMNAIMSSMKKLIIRIPASR